MPPRITRITAATAMIGPSGVDDRGGSVPGGGPYGEYPGCPNGGCPPNSPDPDGAAGPAGRVGAPQRVQNRISARASGAPHRLQFTARSVPSLSDRETS